METGGTRVYPGTHRDINLGAKVNGGTVEHVENPQKAGDALVFDGLLQHHGTENVSGMKNGVNDAVEKAHACVNDENFPTNRNEIDTFSTWPLQSGRSKYICNWK